MKRDANMGCMIDRSVVWNGWCGIYHARLAALRKRLDRAILVFVSERDRTKYYNFGSMRGPCALENWFRCQSLIWIFGSDAVAFAVATHMPNLRKHCVTENMRLRINGKTRESKSWCLCSSGISPPSIAIFGWAKFFSIGKQLGGCHSSFAVGGRLWRVAGPSAFLQCSSSS